MILQQIRNSTLLLHFAGKKLLIDPVLSENPSDRLPVSLKELLSADAVILTSLHPDHFDDAARDRLPKTIPVFVQDKMDQVSLKGFGFSSVQILGQETSFGNIRLTRTPLNGNPCGVLITHPAEKDIFVTGDSVWNDGFLKAVHTIQPRAIAVNCGPEGLTGATPADLGKEDIAKLHDAAPKSSIIICHIDAFSQWGLSRKLLKEYASENNLSHRFLIPEDSRNYYL